jgi:hypothetical protein
MSATKKTLKDTKYHDSIIRARNLMICDIEKSLRLANEILVDDKLPVGAPNFLLALGLCCYTEYWGKLVEGISKQLESKKGIARKSFETFLKRMDCKYYTNLLENKKTIYRDIRCGLAHMYLIENAERATIDSGNLGSHGIEYNITQDYYILWIRRYFEEFRIAVDFYISELNGGKEHLVDKLEKSLNGRPILI